MAKPEMSCPSLKRCFPTRSSAEGERRRYNGGGGRVYRCGCSWYHVTSSAHRGTARGRERAKQRQRQWRD